jgi:hypothetical protein
VINIAMGEKPEQLKELEPAASTEPGQQEIRFYADGEEMISSRAAREAGDANG